jgi:DNA repair exonuclease SbcCD ATPase subunit
MSKLAVGLFVAMLTCSIQAQLSPEEAKAKLEERNAKRLAERSQMVQVSAGELADLRARIAQLEGEIKTLRSQTGQKAGYKKPPETIEIGMTKDEVIAFVKAHSALQVISISASAGISKSSQQTTVKRLSSDINQRTENGGPVHRTTAEGDNESKVQVDTVRVAGKQERMVIGRYATHSEQSGTQRNALGGSSPVYTKVEREEGRISVTLVDGIVTEVSAN